VLLAVVMPTVSCSAAVPLRVCYCSRSLKTLAFSNGE